MARRISSVFRVIFLIALCAFYPFQNVEAVEEEGKCDATMRIFFIPFEAESYQPISFSGIEEAAFSELWFDCAKSFGEPSLVREPHPFSKRLGRVLFSTKGSKPIDDQSIRLKIEIGKDVVYADRNGTVLRKDTDQIFKLSKKQIRDLHKKLEYLSGVVDLKAARRVFGARE